MTDNTPTTATKECSICRRIQPLSEFHRRRHYVRSGLRAACKDCTREAVQLVQAERPRQIDVKKHRVRARTQHAIRRQYLVPQPCRVCGNPNVEARRATVA